jgi:hypothetical protein
MSIMDLSKALSALDEVESMTVRLVGSDYLEVGKPGEPFISGGGTIAHATGAQDGSQGRSDAESVYELIPIHYKIGGFSGIKIKTLLNKLLSHDGVKYLEVGVFCGSTFIPAMYGNSPEAAYAVDNWSEFAGQRDFFLANCDIFLGDGEAPEKIEGAADYRPGRMADPDLIPSASTLQWEYGFKLLEKDFFATTSSDFDDTKFNVYFYDGNHEEENQSRALEHMVSIGALEDEFILLVDDYAWEGVERGTQSAIKDLNLKVLREETFGVPCPPAERTQRENWWNGLYVAHLKR